MVGRFILPPWFDIFAKDCQTHNYFSHIVSVFSTCAKSRTVDCTTFFSADVQCRLHGIFRKFSRSQSAMGWDSHPTVITPGEDNEAVHLTQVADCAIPINFALPETCALPETSASPKTCALPKTSALPQTRALSETRALPKT